MTKCIRTGTKSKDSQRRIAEQSGVNACKLSIDETLQLRIPWGILAKRCGGHDTIDIQCVSGMLAIGNRISYESGLVRDTGRFCKVDHSVGVVLLSARVGVGQKCIDTIYARKSDARLVRGNVTAANKAQILPALSNVREISLSNSPSESNVRRPLSKRCASRGSINATTETSAR